MVKCIGDLVQIDINPYKHSLIMEVPNVSVQTKHYGISIDQIASRLG